MFFDCKFDSIYKFRENISVFWNFNIIIVRNIYESENDTSKSRIFDYPGEVHFEIAEVFEIKDSYGRSRIFTCNFI